jgi:5,10-methylene-tetrahydrofolate dehydrogenase/methenyl tetrahydrofolate cyclohydrolase
MAVELLSSDALVKGRREEIITAVASASEAPIYCAAGSVEGADQGVDSYLRQLRRELGSLGLQYEEIRGADAAEVAARLRQQHGKPGANIVMTPNPDLPTLLPVLSEHPARDGDAMTAAGCQERWPATPRSILGLAELAVGGREHIDPSRTAVVGANGAVNGKVVEWLDERGLKPKILIDRGNAAEAIPNLHRDADLVITATGRAGLIGPRDLLRTTRDGRNPRPMAVIDAGVGVNPKTGVTHGDVDPLLYAYGGDQELRITPAPVICADGTVIRNGGGVGRLTVVEFIAGGVMDVAKPQPVLAGA